MLLRAFTVLTFAILMVSVSCSTMNSKNTVDKDPFIKLEDIRSDESMAWVKNENQQSSSYLKANPAFNSLKNSIKDILASKEKIPSITIVDEYAYNHWTDEKILADYGGALKFQKCLKSSLNGMCSLILML